jgi:hypothetical protein
MLQTGSELTASVRRRPNIKHALPRIDAQFLCLWQHSGGRWLPAKQDALQDAYGTSFSLTEGRKVKPPRPPNLVRLPTWNSTLNVRKLQSSLVFQKSRVQMLAQRHCMLTEIFRDFSQPLRANVLQLTLYRPVHAPPSSQFNSYLAHQITFRFFERPKIPYLLSKSRH